MEILSDATFRGNVSINGGNFSVTRPGESRPIIVTAPGGANQVNINGSISVSDNAYISKILTVYNGVAINGSLCLNSSSISSWDEIKGCQCHILRFRSPIIPASCNTFYFVNPDGSNAIIHDSGIAGSVSEFFITQVYDGLSDNFGKVVQMETSLKVSSDGSGFNLIGTIASHNEEIPKRSYVAVVNI